MSDPTIIALMQRVRALERKMNNSLSRGTLSSLTNGKTAKAKVTLMADEVHDDIEYPQQFGFISSPPVGSEVITAHFGGNRSHGTVVAAFNKAHAPTTLGSGESAQYSAIGSMVHAKTNGDIEINTASGATVKTKNDGSVEINASGTTLTIATDGTITTNTSMFTIDGDLTVTGTIIN